MSIKKLSDKFNRKQIQVWEYDQKHKPFITILEGSVRSGKTFIMLFLWLKHILKFKNKGYKFLMLGYTSASLKKNCLDDLESFFGLNVDLNKNNEFQLFGNTVCVFGADNYGSYKAMRGLTAYGLFGNEVTLHHENSLEEAFNRCSGDGARVFFDTNPDYPTHPIKTQFVDKDGALFEDGSVRVKSWHFDIWDNAKSNGGFVPDKYIESLSESMPDGFRKDRTIHGKWVASDGVIYTSFMDKLIIDAPPQIKFYIAGVDWGYDHYGSIEVFGVDHDGNVYLVEEIAARHKEIDWWDEKRKALMVKYKGITFYADTARPEYVRKFRAKNAKKDVIEGIELVQQMMKDEKFFVIKGAAPHFMKEIYAYEWDDKNKKEQPKKENDDAMDAVRYALYTHFRGRKIARPGKRLF